MLSAGMDEFIQTLGKPLNAEAVQMLVERFRLVEDPNQRGHWESSKLGIAVYLDERASYVESVFLFGNGKDDFHEYRGRLPGDLTFRHGRTDVRRVWGEPTRSADAAAIAGNYGHWDWDRYDLPTHVLHFSYERDVGIIELVTLMVSEPKTGSG